MSKKRLANLPQSAVWNLGSSVQGRPLDALALAPAGGPQVISEKPAPAAWPWVLFLGGVHGDEREGVWLIEEMRDVWTKDFPFENVGVVLWARVNADGVAGNSRWNANNVDLNRNLPTKDWTPEIKNPRYPPGLAAGSEPENQVLIRLIDQIRPKAILTAHSFSEFQVNCNGPSREWGEVLAKVCNYPVTEDIGYPTPGSLGTYAGTERKIPTITHEILRGADKERVLREHVAVMQAAVKYWDEKVK